MDSSQPTGEIVGYLLNHIRPAQNMAQVQGKNYKLFPLKLFPLILLFLLLLLKTNLEHLSLERVENNNPHHEPATPTQEVRKKTKGHTACSNSQDTAQQSAYDQATLLCCLRLNHELQRGDHGRYDILAHGPSHQGPRTLLTIITEARSTSTRCPSH